MTDSTEQSADDMSCALHARIAHATEAELTRLRGHLGLADHASREAIEQRYLNAADNSIFAAMRGVVRNDAPTYSKVLRLIYRELRPYAEGLDETWQRVKALKVMGYLSPVDQLSDEELERAILELYRAEYLDLADEVHRQQTPAGAALKPLRKLLEKSARWIPGGGSAMVSSAVTVSAHTAARLPFAAAAPGVAAGPIGLALSVVLVGAQLAGPAYRKIIPTTVELLLIGQRIRFMPEV